MLAEFVYCYLLRPWPLRQLTNWTIRQLLPRQIEIHGATVVLNPTDPVVSGALHFGVYEKAETRFFQSACRDGMTFLDVGANLGYYTALATRAGGGVERIFRRLALGGRFWSQGGSEKLMCVSHNRLLTKRDKLRVSFIIVF